MSFLITAPVFPDFMKPIVTPLMQDLGTQEGSGYDPSTPPTFTEITLQVDATDDLLVSPMHTLLVERRRN